MSIQEALGRGKTERVGKIAQRGISGEDYLRKLAADRKLIDEAKVPELLAELMVAIGPEFPDVRERGFGSIVDLIPDDTQSVVWNRRDETPSGATQGMGRVHVVSMIRVTPNSLTSELSIEGRETEILGLGDWNNPRVLEDAIVRAYRNPMRVVDVPPITMVSH